MFPISARGARSVSHLRARSAEMSRLRHERRYNDCILSQNKLILYEYSFVMPNKAPVILPRMQRILTQLGENIRLARLRRQLSAEQVAQRAGMARSTLVKVEKGESGVGIGHYLNVLKVLGLEGDFALLASDDVLGRKIQDIGLQRAKRAPKKNIQP